jgi:predicted phage terminase large subunit-like protein
MVRRLREQRRAEASLYEFVKAAWHVIEPGAPFVGGWHIEVICEHLEAVTNGDIKRLLINIPPRHAKSIIVGVMWPVWEWLAHPSEKFLCASYSGILSTRDSLKARRLVQSPWFVERWGHLFALTGDQNQKTRFENDKTGYRIATSVGGTATGEGGSRLILDDPHGAQDAQSEAMRETAVEWFDLVWSTRLNNPVTDAMVVIMQRLHENDISGHVLKNPKGWEHVCLPAEFDGVRRKTKLGHYDKRVDSRALLWPERFNTEVIETLKRQLGEYGASGQLQQQPSPTGGGIIKVSHFQRWPVKEKFPAFKYMVQSYDTAFTEKTQGDPTGCITAGVFEYKGQDCLMVLDAWDEHLSYPALRKRALDDWQERYGVRDEQKGRRADIILIEAKGSGLSLIQDMQMSNVPICSYNPGFADKISRAHQVAPIIELDCVYIPESKKHPGEFVTWAKPFVEQVGKFPKAEHDEYVDCLTQMIIILRNKGYFALQVAEREEPEEADYTQRRKANPYGQ